MKSIRLPGGGRYYFGPEDAALIQELFGAHPKNRRVIRMALTAVVRSNRKTGLDILSREARELFKMEGEMKAAIKKLLAELKSPR